MRILFYKSGDSSTQNECVIMGPWWLLMQKFGNVCITSWKQQDLEQNVLNLKYVLLFSMAFVQRSFYSNISLESFPWDISRNAWMLSCKVAITTVQPNQKLPQPHNSLYNFPASNLKQVSSPLPKLFHAQRWTATIYYMQARKFSKKGTWIKLKWNNQYRMNGE